MGITHNGHTERPGLEGTSRIMKFQTLWSVLRNRWALFQRARQWPPLSSADWKGSCWNHWVQDGLTHISSPDFLWISFQELEGSYKISPEPSLRWRAPALSASLPPQGRCSRSLILFIDLLWTGSNNSMSFSCWGLQNWMQYSRWWLMRAEKKVRITSLDLMVTLLFMQTRIQLAFCTARAHAGSCWVFHQLTSPNPSPQGFFQAIHHSAFICAWYCTIYVC